MNPLTPHKLVQTTVLLTVKSLSMSVHGVVDVKIGLPSGDLSVTAYVVDGLGAGVDLLLGHPEMSRNKLYCVPHARQIMHGLVTYPYHEQGEVPQASITIASISPAVDSQTAPAQSALQYFDTPCLSYLAENVTLKPREMTKVPARLDVDWLVSNGLMSKGHVFQLNCITDCLVFKDTPSVALDSMLVLAEEGVAPLYLCNSTNEPVTLEKGCPIAVLSIIRGDLTLEDLPSPSIGLTPECQVRGHANVASVGTSDVSVQLPPITSEDLQPMHFTKNEPKLLKILNENREAVAKQGETLGVTSLVEHHIHLKTGTPPVYTPAYRLPHSWRAAADACVQEMLRDGIIQESTSPWNSPLLLVPKKDGTYRPVVDFRKLNAVSIPERFPLSCISDLLRSLGRNKVFSTLDLLSGFFQVPLDEESRPLTAFSTPSGKWEYVRLPMGLHSAPITFSRLMSIIFRKIIGKEVLVYLDDIIVMAEDVETHLARLGRVFGMLREAGLKVKISKCNFLKDSIKYLGHVVDAHGVHVDQDKIGVIANLPVPVDVNALRTFLGMTGFYRMFVESYARIASPLTQLLKKDTPYEWGSDQQSAFNVLRDRLINTPVLKYPDFAKPFYVCTDASSRAIGACLMQDHKGKMHPISYASRTLTSPKKNYAVTELEGLAVVWGLRKFREFILGYEVIVQTDHRPLVGLLSTKDPTGKFLRWFQSIQEFDPLIKYVPGKTNWVADCLSRNVCLVTGEETDLQNRIAHEQAKDPFWSVVRDFLLKKIPDLPFRPPVPLKELSLSEDGVLQRRVMLGAPCREVTQVVIPTSLVPEVLRLVHDSPQSGHPGKDRTVKATRLKYFWPKMALEIAQHVDACPSCQSNKGNTLSPQTVLHYPVPHAPWERVSMDILGGLTVTKRGAKYLLVVTDYLTR